MSDVQTPCNRHRLSQAEWKLFPDVCCMMNVDGGSSSVLGMVAGGSFMELSYPAPSLHSCAGMARRISTVLRLEPHPRPGQE